MRLLATLLLLLGACGPGGKGYTPPPTWDSEDLVGLWKLIPEEDFTIFPVLLVQFSNDIWDVVGMYSELRIVNVWDEEWTPIKTFASHGDITGEGIVDFSIDFREDYDWRFSYWEGAMEEDKLTLNGMAHFWGGEGPKLVMFTAEKL